MKYIPNSNEVEAFRIIAIQQSPEGQVPPFPRTLTLENNTKVTATSEMLSRHLPSVGDYWVMQADGHVYLSPKDVFEARHQQAAVAPTTPAPPTGQQWPRSRKWQAPGTGR